MRRLTGTRDAKFILVLVLLATAAFFFFLNAKMPLAGEDYNLQPWGYNYGRAPISFQEKFVELWKVAYGHAVRWSPRIGEGLAILIGAFPKPVFNIVNTLIFIWLVFLLFGVSFGRFPAWGRPSDVFAVFVIVFLLITLCPLFGSIFIWKSGTTNHTWGLVFLLSFMLPFRMNHRKPLQIRGGLGVFALSLLGLLAGLSVENASAVVLAGLLLYVILPGEKTRLDRRFVIPFTAFAAGVIILLFSPGTTVRRSYYAGVIDYGTLQGVALYAERLRRIGHDFFAASWPLLAVFGVVLTAYLLLVWKKENLGSGQPRRTKLDGLPVSGIFVLLFVAALSVVAMAAVAYQGDQRRGFEFFWLIVISLTACLVTEIWNRFSSALVRLPLVLSLLALIMLQAWDMARVYARFDAENQVRLALIFAARADHRTEVTLPALTVRDSRIVETREVLEDLGARMARYWGLKAIHIQK